MGGNLQEKKYTGVFAMIPLQRIKKIMKEEGAERVSKEAIKKLDKILEKEARKIIKKAARNANFYGRSTVKEKDITEE